MLDTKQESPIKMSKDQLFMMGAGFGSSPGLEHLNVSPILINASPEQHNPLLYITGGSNPAGLAGMHNSSGSPLLDLNTGPPTFDNNLPPARGKKSNPFAATSGIVTEEQAYR